MAFPAIGAYNGGVCPQSHPKAIYSVFYEFFYDTSPFTDFNRWVYAMGDPTGYGLHGDFINGWTDQNALVEAVPTCQGPDGFYSPSCSVNVREHAVSLPCTYNSTETNNIIKQAGEGSAVSLTPQVPAPTEAVGLSGPIPALPGNNPVTGTPIKKRSRVVGDLKW